jgi:hypothetical protein
MKSKGNLTKERFCRDEELKKQVTMEGTKARKEGHKNLKKKKNDELERRKKERANNRKELEAMPMHLP